MQRFFNKDFTALLIQCLLGVTCWAGFIDMDTPLNKRTTRSLVDGTIYKLVMSDEFNVPNRTFKDGHDPVWTALDKSDDDSSSAGGGSQHFYNSSFITTTQDGRLKITAIAGKTEWDRYDHLNKTWKHQTSYFKSGMLQSWEKFCFTGGIVEVDVQLPGDPYIGGIWPAVWMLGNLGRATYEASTNNVWPWSFDTCDRKLQPAQAISACNAENHYGMHPHQGRGATEIDIVEVMTGDSRGALPETDPPIELPYADFTLQVAPGVTENRPQSGSLPVRHNTLDAKGHTEYSAQTWYDGLMMKGNTSVNPFFYGTYLAETKKGEPVTRTKKQAFQADAVGVCHQLTPSHFKRAHTYRLEWQPGPGGRLDWFVKSYRFNGPNGTEFIEGNGNGREWTHAYSLHDKSLRDLMGSQIPIEPSYLIMNIAISSTWGFPYDTPDWCQKCYDCEDPKCACTFYPGFCKMMKEGINMYIDSVRVYQSNDSTAHVGANHTLGCDPPDFPTKEWVEGHSYRYMRNPPFVYEDVNPLRRIQRGGGFCDNDADCGSDLNHENLTEAYLNMKSIERRRLQNDDINEIVTGHGQCVARQDLGGMFSSRNEANVCKCNPGYTGPFCMAQAHFDTSPSAKQLRLRHSPFTAISHLQMTPFMLVVVLLLFIALVVQLWVAVVSRKEDRMLGMTLQYKVATPENTNSSRLVITGRSI